MRLSTLRLMRSSSCARLLCAVLLLAETAFAASVKTPDGASWPRFRHGLSQTGVAGTTLPAKLELLWEIELGDQILATAAIVGDDVYIPCLSGELACVDRLTGQKRWSYKTLDPVPDNSFAPGFKSAPTVTADAVYIGDEEGKFHAIDRVTGRQRWTFETQGEIYSSAAVADGRVIFGSYDNSLYCLGETDGKLKWKFETGGYVHCSPAVAEGFTFIAGCDEHLRIINIETGEEAGDLPLQTYLIASPAVVGDRLYVGTYASEVVAVDWKKKTSSGATTARSPTCRSIPRQRSQPTGWWSAGATSCSTASTAQRAKKSGRSPPAARSTAPRSSSATASSSDRTTATSTS